MDTPREPTHHVLVMGKKLEFLEGCHYCKDQGCYWCLRTHAEVCDGNCQSMPCLFDPDVQKELQEFQEHVRGTEL